MSEQIHTSDEPKPEKRRFPWLPLTAAGVLGGVAVFGIISWADSPAVHAQNIYADVPAQVEFRHQPTTRCSYTVGFGGACAQETTTYKMTIEQCPADVEAARRGEASDSLDRAVGAIGTGCVTEVLQVPAAIWKGNGVGSVLVFDGAPAKPLTD
jgi:hypothetical protein